MFFFFWWLLMASGGRISHIGLFGVYCVPEGGKWY